MPEEPKKSVQEMAFEKACKHLAQLGCPPEITCPTPEFREVPSVGVECETCWQYYICHQLKREIDEKEKA